MYKLSAFWSEKNRALQSFTFLLFLSILQRTLAFSLWYAPFFFDTSPSSYYDFLSRVFPLVLIRRTCNMGTSQRSGFASSLFLSLQSRPVSGLPLFDSRPGAGIFFLMCLLDFSHPPWAGYPLQDVVAPAYRSPRRVGRDRWLGRPFVVE